MDASREIAVLQGIERNPPLDPLSFQSVNIHGKHGQILFLDPRRVLPLPENPRWKNNPGFSAESLRNLGRSIRATGQLEVAKVIPTSEPGYDAQLIDGERRLRGCRLAECMIKVEVREDVTDEKALLVLSVVSNFGKEGHTCLEIAHAVGKFRAMDMKFEEISDLFGKSLCWVQQHASLLKLDQEVQDLLVVAPESTITIDGEEVETVEFAEKGRRKRTRGISFSLALNLVDLPPSDQKAIAKHVIENDMPLTKARRYILGYRREAGKEKKTRRNRPRDRFTAFEGLVGRTVDGFGIYEDMKTSEFRAFLEKQSPHELRQLLKEIRGLSATLNGVQDIISSLVPKI